MSAPPTLQPTRRARRHTRAAPRVLALAALLLGCGEPRVDSAPPTAVKVAAVARAGAGAAAAARYSARIEPAAQVELAFKVGGYVESIPQRPGVDGKPRLLQEGDAVQAGMELAALRVTDSEQKLREASAALVEAAAAAEQAKLDFERTSQLEASGIEAPAQLDAARLRRDSTGAALAGAKVRVEEAQTTLADTHLRSPIDGVLLRRALEIGALAAAGVAAFTVAETDRVKVVFGVPDTALARVHLGERQRIRTESLRDVDFEGLITRVAPAADEQSRVFEVEVTLDNADQRLKAGMVAALELASGAQPAGEQPLVPLAAIVRSPRDPAQYAVYVVDESAAPARARATEVELGDYLGNVIPVTRGLSGGERIVVMGAALLSDGEPIAVIP